jgi:hypothetical protein
MRRKQSAADAFSQDTSTVGDRACPRLIHGFENGRRQNSSVLQSILTLSCARKAGDRDKTGMGIPLRPAPQTPARPVIVRAFAARRTSKRSSAINFNGEKYADLDHRRRTVVRATDGSWPAHALGDCPALSKMTRQLRESDGDRRRGSTECRGSRPPRRLWRICPYARRTEAPSPRSLIPASKSQDGRFQMREMPS